MSWNKFTMQAKACQFCPGRLSDWSLLASLLLMICASGNSRAALGEGADLEFGAYGEGQGKFRFLRDFTFGPQGRIYVLDGTAYVNEEKAVAGNLLVQIFDPAGAFVSQFSIVPPTRQPSPGDPKAGRSNVPGIYNDPQRLAVDGQGNVFVTQPAASVVQVYAAAGTLAREIPVPQAMVISRWRDAIAVLGSNDEALPGKGWTPLGGENILVLDATGATKQTIPLSRRLIRVEDMDSDAAGNFFFQADKNQLYQFSPTGELMKIIGSGTSARRSDGSELIHSVTVDQAGGLYSMTVGNPGMVTQFSPDRATVTQRGGQFKWADSWSYPDLRTVMRVDAHNRLWVAATGQNNPSRPNSARHHPSPSVMRLREDYLHLGAGQVRQSSALTLGLSPKIDTTLVESIAHDLQPIPVKFTIEPAVRNVSQVTAVWHAYDMYKATAGEGRFEMALENGQAASQEFTFKPPQFGWYTVEVKMLQGTQWLATVGKHFGVTPPHPGMPTLKAGQSKGGWEDPWRQAFIGHPILRLHPAGGLDRFEQALTAAEQAGVFVFGQFTDQKDCTIENVSKTVARFKGRVKVWEIMNEPNFGMKPEAYAELLKTLYPVIKGLDPEAKVMGPTVCGIQIGYYEKVYQAGAKDYFDLLSIHDYEGHESIDPVHWRWKLGALRALMSKYGDPAKPIWQTERAIGGVRGGLFLGGSQAVRVLLQQDLLASLGVPEGRNYLYYLNEGGYSTVPTFMWSSVGPHPAALALRTRQAMVQGRSLDGSLDFGPLGNRFMFGLRFTGTNGSTVILRNLGTHDFPLALAVSGGRTMQVTDAFGNARALPVRNGRAALVLAQMPLYLNLEKGQQVDMPKLDAGENLAPGASFAYSEKAANVERLNDGVWNTYQAGNPDGDTDGKKLFIGDLTNTPTTLTMSFPAPQTIGTVLTAGLHADNNFCALLDYDLQYERNGKWVTLKQVRTPVPPSDWAKTPGCLANTWYLDNNCFLDSFDPVRTKALRWVVHRTTLGFAPDALANLAVRQNGGGKGFTPRLYLREIEAYARRVN